MHANGESFLQTVLPSAIIFHYICGKKKYLHGQDK